MAYVNNGISRSLKFTVNKWVGGIQTQGFPHSYNGQNYWGNILYPTLTDQQLRQLSDVDFMARYNAFTTYVESIEGGSEFGVDIVGDGPTKSDPTCLTPPTTTTTTTAAVSTTTTAALISTTTTTVAANRLFVGYVDINTYPTPDIYDTNKNIPDIGESQMRIWFSTSEGFGNDGAPLLEAKNISFNVSKKYVDATVLEMKIVGSNNINGVVNDIGYNDAHYVGGLSIPAGVKTAYIDFMLNTDDPTGNGCEYDLFVLSPAPAYKDTLPLRGVDAFGWNSVAENVLIGDFAIRAL